MSDTRLMEALVERTVSQVLDRRMGEIRNDVRFDVEEAVSKAMAQQSRNSAGDLDALNEKVDTIGAALNTTRMDISQWTSNAKSALVKINARLSALKQQCEDDRRGLHDASDKLASLESGVHDSVAGELGEVRALLAELQRDVSHLDDAVKGQAIDGRQRAEHWRSEFESRMATTTADLEMLRAVSKDTAACRSELSSELSQLEERARLAERNKQSISELKQVMLRTSERVQDGFEQAVQRENAAKLRVDDVAAQLERQTELSARNVRMIQSLREDQAALKQNSAELKKNVDTMLTMVRSL